ncbi:MAG: Type secretion system protein [Candidatus Hydrogenedentes bacterium]|nr:Type secretion system protein [Candidatus Hydrogenedentota bacterium]
MRRHGFTLFELLLVIGLMGLATTLGGAILLEVMEAWDRVSVRTGLDAMAQTVFDRLDTDFGDMLSSDLTGVSLVVISRSLEDGNQPAGQVLPDDMLIVPVCTSTDPAGAVSGTTVMYQIERENGRDLLVQTTGDLQTDIPIGGRVELIPRADVLSMRVEYADKNGVWLEANGEEGWFKGLPRAVRISLTLADLDRPDEQISRSKVFPIHVD